MSGSYLNYTIDYFLVESYDGEVVYDMTQCVSSVEYFEDLFSPSIFLRLLLVNTNGELTTLSKNKDKEKYGMRGGERVSLKISQLGTNKSIDLDETKTPYYIYKISDSSTEYTREVLTVDLAPEEIFKNETIRVTKKYKDKTINESVTDILKDVLKTNNYKSSNIEKSQNTYSFFGNNRKPFTVLTWLAAKSVPASISESSTEKGTAGFLFYQNQHGYNFKSLDSLFEGLDSNSNRVGIATYSYAPAAAPFNEKQNFLILNTPTFEKNVNVFENMRIGMYSSSNTFFDLNTKKADTYVYKLTESYEIMKHSSSKNDKPEIPLNLQDNPSRIMVKLIDSIVTKTDKDADPLKENDPRTKYQSQSVARYNLAFSQVLNITIPLNLNLSVGDIVNLDFGLITKDSVDKGIRDDIKSGKYLIQQLCHNFSKKDGYTGLKVVRDSYGV